MNVKFSQEAEEEQRDLIKRMREALDNKSKSWELLRSPSLVAVTRKAKELGWADKKVQVRIEKEQGQHEYVIEPFEKDCGCPGLLKFSDFFLTDEERNES